LTANWTSLRTHILFGSAYGLGLSVVLWAVTLAPPPLEALPLLFLAAGACTGLMRPRLPGIGQISLAFPYVLTALFLFGLGAATLTGALAACGAGLPLGRKLSGYDLQHMAFRMGSRAITVFLAGAACLYLVSAQGHPPGTLSVIPLLGFAAVSLTLELIQRGLLVATGTGSASRRPAHRLLIRGLAGTLMGTALVPLVVASYNHPVAQLVVLAVPLIYPFHLLIRLTLERGKARLERSKILTVMQRDLTHALAAAINAGNRQAGQQLEQTRALCLALSDQLGLPVAYRDALSTAVLLHSVGSVTSPDSTHAAFDHARRAEPESIRSHPVRGSELLKAIAFPPQIAAIVRHHHERWDGSGYPDRIAGEDIPIGARILSVVNHHSLLISGSRHRKPLSSWDAQAHLQHEAGQSHDPAVVDALLDVLGEHPASEQDLEDDSPVKSVPELECVRLPLAQRNLNVMYDLARMATYPIEFEECLTLFSNRLDDLVPYRSLVLYLLDPTQSELQARFARGQGARTLGCLTLQIGERTSGRAVLYRQAIIEDNLSIGEGPCGSDLDELHDDPGVNGLCATLAAPLIIDGQALGTLTLYDHQSRCFSSEDRSHLVDAAGHLARSVQRWKQYEEIGSTGLTDPLTGLPNNRLLRHELSSRIADRVSEDQAAFGLLAFKVCNLTDVGERFGVAQKERLLCRIAHWLAVSSPQGETLTRIGQDLFVVVTPIHHFGELVERAANLTGEVPAETLKLPAGIRVKIRLEAAHATYPADGETADELFETLDSRLSLVIDLGHSVVPFKNPKTVVSAG
jgi:diguanylate cyclase (GGDEF)-like protein